MRGDDDRARRVGQLGQLAGGFKTVHTRHLPVQKGDFAGPACQVRGACQVHGLRPRTGQRDRKTHAGQQLGQDLPGLFAVVHHQHAAATQVGFRQQWPLHGRAQTQSRCEPEGAALAWRAVHAHLAAHQAGQFLGNRQAQAGAAVLARGGGVGLLERAKQARLLFFGQADARVLHFKAQQHALGIPRCFAYPHDDLALVRELDGIVGVVHQDLPQPQGVSTQVGGQVGVHVEHQLQAFAGAFFAQQVGHVVEHGMQVEIHHLDFELARLDFAEIQDVIDQAQQVLSRPLDLFDVVALARGQLGGQSQVAHANHGVHGRADLVAHVGQEV
ncbi:hypothetical protein D3C71_699910 [compost metagenome]